jgi:molybdopterin/thiamine biosynthesis adenylyltransferase
MPLTDEERAIYEWQLSIPDLAEAGQEKLKDATVLISRLGGLGGTVAYQLAAAGVGRLILAHAGNLKPSDLNRQLLMTHAHVGQPRIESAKRRLQDFNPRLEILAVPENINESNVADLVTQADLIIDACPRFEERFLLNQEAVRQSKPMVECAMYSMEAQLTTFIPHQTPCLVCLYPTIPTTWTRKFPVLGAVSGTVACLGAIEAIKLITGLGTTLAGHLLTMDLRTMQFQKHRITRNPNCPICTE